MKIHAFITRNKAGVSGKGSYIIFICTFDPFGGSRYIYHFENLCREDPAIRLKDGTEKVFLNTKGTRDDVGEDLRRLLEYFESMVPRDAYTRELEDAVAEAREHTEWRREYMKLEAWEQRIRWEGRSEGGTARLVSQIIRKVKKGRTPEETAEDLDEDTGEVRRIYEVVVKHLPDCDQEKILAELLDKA